MQRVRWWRSRGGVGGLEKSKVPFSHSVRRIPCLLKFFSKRRFVQRQAIGRGRWDPIDNRVVHGEAPRLEGRTGRRAHVLNIVLVKNNAGRAARDRQMRESGVISTAVSAPTRPWPRRQWSACGSDGCGSQRRRTRAAIPTEKGHSHQVCVCFGQQDGSEPISHRVSI